jgi:hypothetical protein
MCGIAGIFRYRGGDEDSASVQPCSRVSINAERTTRESLWPSPSCSAIVGLRSSGQQRMQSASGRYNGTCYGWPKSEHPDCRQQFI